MNEVARHPAAAAPHRPIAYAAARVTRTTDPDGTIRVACPVTLPDHDPSVARLFRRAVAAQPGRTFLQERAGAKAIGRYGPSARASFIGRFPRRFPVAV